MADRLAQNRTLVGVLVVAVVVLVAIGIIVALADDDSRGAEFEDGAGECREPGRDFGDRCDAGADVVGLHASYENDVMSIAVELDVAPDLASTTAWRIQLNVASQIGKVCGITNIDDEAGPGDAAVDYGFDPAFGLDPRTRRAVADGVCSATLDGSTVHFVIDMEGEDPDEQLRVTGFSLIEFPTDDERPGSEDDFGFRATLADLS